MTKSVIICVDDEKIVLSSLKAELSDVLAKNQVIELAETGEEALEIINECLEKGYNIPLVISDYIMPTMKGDELLKQVHRISPKTFKILLTGQADIKVIKNIINNANLYRFITKPWDRNDLAMTVKEALKSFSREKLVQKQYNMLVEMNNNLEVKVRERTEELEKYNRMLEFEILERKKAEEALEQKVTELLETKQKLEEANHKLEVLSSLDGLTEIPNRRSFDKVLEREWRRSIRHGFPISLCMIDIDFFKNYNDLYGHLAGDECIRQVARTLNSDLLRPADFAARYGGEEFSLILPNTDFEGAVFVAEKIRQRIRSLGIPHGSSCVDSAVTISLGTATMVNQTEKDFNQLVDLADKALYLAKNNGRNCTYSLSV